LLNIAALAAGARFIGKHRRVVLGTRYIYGRIGSEEVRWSEMNLVDFDGPMIQSVNLSSDVRIELT
jgi:hypothetical protein